MRTESYPSDVTDEQWPLIEPHIPVYPGGRPRITPLRDVVDAVFYILRTGCHWRYIPKDFPPRSTVWRYFDEWRHNGTLDKIHDMLRRKVRTAEHVVDLVQGAVVPPLVEVPPDRAPGREVLGDVSPMAAGAEDVEDGVDDVP